MKTRRIHYNRGIKKYFFLAFYFFIFFFLIIACNSKKSQLIIKYPDGTPEIIISYSGDTSFFSMNEYYPNGKIHKQAIVKNGSYVGNKITYFQNGNIEQLDSLFQPCDTSSNKWDGILIRYNDNNTMSQKYTIRNGLFNGLFMQFNSNGKLVKQYVIKEDSIKNGLYEEFYDNGIKAFEATYRNDTIIGFVYYFNRKDDTIKYYNTYKGVIDFPFKKWLRDGSILEGDYADTISHAVIWKWYSSSGVQIKSKLVKPNQPQFIVPE